MDSDDGDVDIEGEFNVDISECDWKSTQLTHNLLNQEAGLIDLDPDSRQVVLDLLEGDGQTDSTDTKRALRNTSRQVRLTAEEKLVFQRSLEIYGESWEQIATLLPFRTTDEVRRFGVSYLKKEKRLSNLKRKAMPKQFSESAPSFLHTQQSVTSTQAPTHSASVQAPAHTASTQAPAHSASVQAPAHSASTQAPAHSASVQAPAHTASTQAPAPTVSTQAPAHSASVQAPAHSASVQAPAHSASVQAPAPTVSTQAPAHTVSTQAPAHTASIQAPTHTASTQAPVHTVSIQAPAHTASMQTVRSDSNQLTYSARINKHLATGVTEPTYTLHIHSLSSNSSSDVTQPPAVSVNPDISPPPCKKVAPALSVTTQSPASMTSLRSPARVADISCAGGSDLLSLSAADSSEEVEISVTDPPAAENFPLTFTPVSRRAELSDTPPNSSDTLTDTSSQPVHRLEFGVLNSEGDFVPKSAPLSEYVFEDAGEITDEEKSVISEFFIGRDRKTPERYLQYRTFIISKWESLRPSYVSKSRIRREIPYRGDVRVISRIHDYLEQIGAINFGCSEATYQILVSSGVRAKSTSHQDNRVAEKETVTKKSKRNRRPPQKWTPVDGPITADVTYAHGYVDETPRPILEPSKPEKRVSKGLLSSNISLMGCSEFDGDKFKAPYDVILESTAAIVMDVHSHLCKTEVIGLLGGVYNSTRNVVTVVRAEPCSSTSTSLHCDMDPVSQTEAGETIKHCGLQVVGWYHSHPTFAPNPSQQDIDSQRIFQNWFSSGGDNFLGVIVSPYNPLNPSPISQITCFTTYRDDAKAISIPFKFNYRVQTTPNSLELSTLVTRLKKLLLMYRSYEHLVDLLDSYRTDADISALEKLLLSLEDHLITADVGKVDTRLLLEDVKFIISTHFH